MIKLISITEGRWMLFTIVLCTLHTSAQSQSRIIPFDSIQNHHFISVEQGVTLNLPEKETIMNIHQELTADYFLGITYTYIYKDWNFSTGLIMHQYTTGLEVSDEPIKSGTGTESSIGLFNYCQIPLRLGLTINTSKKWLTITPFLSASILTTWAIREVHSSYTTDTLMSPSDTSYSTFSTGMSRNYNTVLAFGGGAQVNASFHKLHIAFFADYFRSNLAWYSLYARYHRESNLQGTLDEKATIQSYAKTINLGISIGYIIK